MMESTFLIDFNDTIYQVTQMQKFMKILSIRKLCFTFLPAGGAGAGAGGGASHSSREIINL